MDIPANVALAVHPNMKYVKAKQGKECIHCCEKRSTSSTKRKL